MEILAAAHLVQNDQGETFTVYEMWRSVGWLGLVGEIEFRLAGGEVVEQLATNTFVIPDTCELLTRSMPKHQPDCNRTNEGPETENQCA